MTGWQNGDSPRISFVPHCSWDSPHFAPFFPSGYIHNFIRAEVERDIQRKRDNELAQKTLRRNAAAEM